MFLRRFEEARPDGFEPGRASNPDASLLLLAVNSREGPPGGIEMTRSDEVNAAKQLQRSNKRVDTRWPLEKRPFKSGSENPNPA
jgi:hypothetical protein